MPDCFLAAKLCPPKNLRGGILELGHGNDVVSVHSPDYYNTANSFCKGVFCLFLYKLCSTTIHIGQKNKKI